MGLWGIAITIWFVWFYGGILYPYLWIELVSVGYAWFVMLVVEVYGDSIVGWVTRYKYQCIII